MDATVQPSTLPVPSLSRVSQILVASWHFLVAAITIGGLTWAWRTSPIGDDDRSLIKVLFAVVLSLCVIYVIAGWGILNWKNWSRILALALNWINLVLAALQIRPIGVERILSALASCLVLWRLSMPTVKLAFRSAIGRR
jgi:hypothetical protein